ncbi:MAG: hypothetical protein A2V70_01295 [Planctomycetes bacterium RBG_13_63_9]|nr:MAG: hypothetical protein A2V70_01295 [Planctomycetes bacterium RBG_13_63_9]
METKSAIVKLANVAQRSKNKLMKLEEESHETVMHAVYGVEVLVGGALGGVADGLAGGAAGEAEVIGVPVVPVVGAILAATSLAGYPGARHVGSVGIGATTYWLGKFIHEAF